MSWEKRVNGLQYLTTGSVSQYAVQTLIWDPWWFTPFKKNTTDPEEVILQGGGKGFLVVSENAAKNWEDQTAYLELTGPPNTWEDSPAPIMNDVIVKQIHGDIHKLGRFCAIAQLATGTVTDPRGWLLVTNNDWFTTEWTGLNGINLSTSTDWILLPKGAYSNHLITDGTAGTGDIANDGTNFVLTSTLIDIGGGSMAWAIGLIVDAFRTSQLGDTSLNSPPSGAGGGTLTFVASTNFTNMSQDGRAVAIADCNTIFDLGPPSVTGNNVVFAIWFHNQGLGSFTVTLRVDSTPELCADSLVGIIPLAIDVDNETGKRAYVTAWTNGNLILQNWDVTETTPSLTSKYTIATVAITEVEQKTAYAVPFCLADTNVSDYGDVVYIFGYFNGSHIKKSTDGGATFGANLGSPAWGTNRVSAFIAIDQNTWYAWLKTATSTSQLWRTANGGTTWVQINTLPVAPEHQCISRHASGNLLIGNSDTGPVGAVVLTGNYEGQYIDYTGPAAGSRLPGAGDGGGGLSSIIWV